MHLVVVGLNHRTAPLEVREQFAFSRSELPWALDALKTAANQGVVLSTCNRMEVYTLASSAAQGRSQVEQFFAQLGRNLEEVSSHLYILEHLEAARHLFRVVCGLDSLILGETEILGQARDAYGAAVAQRAARGVISHVFHHALRVGKRARRETGISRNALSVSAACVELARRALGDLRGKDVLVIGLGEAGRLAARALTAAGAGSLTMTNRTYQRAVELAAELGGTAVPLEELESLLERSDVVVSTTEAPGYILTADTLRRITERRSAPLFLVDIAVPRDIDPAVADLPGVVLRDIDDLEAVSEGNRRQREEEAQRVETIVDQEVQRFSQWWDGRQAVPTVAALREQAERIRLQELRKTLRRLNHFSEEEQQRLDAMTKAIVKKLLHPAIASLRNGATEDNVRTLRALFRLDQEEQR
ncbi:MAG: glutamyl-tRNA reductase [Dehalococcoidia bacterium]|nr:glutamyl-tRNA reductase [Dehalococcoidia bacterium]